MNNLEISLKQAFSVGEVSTLDAILDHREKRRSFQIKLGQTYPGCVIISYKCNIPGPIKNNAVITQIFNVGHTRILTTLQTVSWHMVYHKTINLPTGLDGFYVVKEAHMKEVKSAMVQLEETDTLGRLFDIDVLTYENNALHSQSRTALGFSPRKCLICDHEAKACGRSRKHSVSELHDTIIKYLIKERGAESID
ncbi:hypothetical protein AOC36_09210 [Erysipelothrix larvae]|uniref:citrate lyase holo-[acyl-carrier protein] synthase n=1 Tax=Erysipelothrix larvae TaxID=1514105 RepID=A0A0X8H194_9FIRM|nr:citrate lyase holo-[acyl-carrier protein] synthase [Erysipelothrix larvae]AMC94160.1 hypothetical protein AOC36_09210 [Erysipelothrix larvae]